MTFVAVGFYFVAFDVILAVIAFLLSLAPGTACPRNWNKTAKCDSLPMLQDGVTAFPLIVAVLAFLAQIVSMLRSVDKWSVINLGTKNVQRWHVTVAFVVLWILAGLFTGCSAAGWPYMYYQKGTHSAPNEWYVAAFFCFFAGLFNLIETLFITKCANRFDGVVESVRIDSENM